MRFVVLRTIIGLCALAAVNAVLPCQAADEPAAARSPSQNWFNLDDYFRVRRISELALSPRGDRAALIVERPSPADDAVTRTTCIQSLLNTSTLKEIPELKDARQLAWMPNNREIAFLSQRAGSAQVFAYNVEDKTVRQLTSSRERISRFAVAPTGGAVAYAVQPTPGESLYHRMRRRGPAILIDIDRTGFIDFVDDTGYSLQSWGVAELWLEPKMGAAQRLDVPGDTQDFYWSPDGRHISVTYVPSELPITKPQLRVRYTSIGIVDVARNSFRAVANAKAIEGSSKGKIYLGGEWLSDRAILIRRVDDANPWQPDSSFPRLMAARVDAPSDEDQTPGVVTELYPSRSTTRVIPQDRDKWLIQTRVKGTNTLLQVEKGQVRQASILDGLSGSSSLFQFTPDKRAAVFVNESLSRLPELFVWRAGSQARQVTHLNEALSGKRLPDSQSVSWLSPDGTEITGWLIKPDPNTYEYPRPLLTYVHGGPSFAFPNQFAPAMAFWPHPFEVLASRGIAVFIPQYRGTLSYGRKVARPTNVDQEPIRDIVSGIDSLIDAGVADSELLALSGYSHGGWLGPMVATRANRFRAGSFAEGWSNGLVLHELMPSTTNRETHENGQGEPPPYANPQRWLELSPDLHFQGLRMASLFESGSEALASLMLGMPKAARFFGVPSEFYVYPQTGHAISDPQLLRECAERNLDWFLFWLMNEEDPAPSKSEQYARWHRMRAVLSSKE